MIFVAKFLLISVAVVVVVGVCIRRCCVKQKPPLSDEETMREYSLRVCVAFA